MPTNNASDGFYSFSYLFIGKLEPLYAFNFFNVVLDLDSKTRAKEIRFQYVTILFLIFLEIDFFQFVYFGIKSFNFKNEPVKILCTQR